MRAILGAMICYASTLCYATAVLAAGNFLSFAHPDDGLELLIISSGAGTLFLFVGAVVSILSKGYVRMRITAFLLACTFGIVLLALSAQI